MILEKTKYEFIVSRKTYDTLTKDVFTREVNTLNAVNELNNIISEIKVDDSVVGVSHQELSKIKKNSTYDRVNEVKRVYVGSYDLDIEKVAEITRILNDNIHEIDPEIIFFPTDKE